MSKRNFILLIIILIIAVIVVFGFLYFQKSPTAPVDNGGVGTNFFSQFNPFGTKPTPPTVTPPVDVSGYVAPITETQKLRLTKISTMPIAGFTVFSKERLKEVLVAPAPTESIAPAISKKITKKPAPPLTEFAPALRYIAQENGNIYQTFADRVVERKFSTTVIPKVYDAYFGNRGETVVMRHLKIDERTIETFVGNLPKELLGADTTANNEIRGSFLPENIKDISISPDNSKIFYLFENNDNIIGTILNLSTNKKTQIFDSPFTEWLSSWATNNSITLSTKPSASAPGYMYSIDGAGKNLTRVLSKINGLTTLASPNGKMILFADNNLTLSIYHTDTMTSDRLGIKTLPEKCVWSKVGDAIYCAVPRFAGAGAFPDTWYQGEVSFRDQFWKIDAKNGNAMIILDPITIKGGEEVDGVKLAVDDGENYLFFVNKKDNFLWKFDLK